MSPRDPIGLQVPCERCGADIGQRCSGLARADDVHLVRTARAHAAARASYGPPSDATKAAVRRIIAAIRAERGWP